MRVQYNIEFKNKESRLKFRRLIRQASGILFKSIPETIIDALEFFIKNYKV